MAASAVSTLPSSTLSVNFQFEAAWIEVGFVQDSLNHFDEIDATELQRRYVDRNGQFRPGFGVNVGAAQHPIAEIDDQSAVLGDCDEFAGRYLAAGRMGPAAKRLDANNSLTALVDNGLIQELQAVILDRLTQVSLEQLAAGKVGVHRRVINAGAIAAFVLGAIQRHVRIAHDIGRGAAFVIDHRDTDPGADDDILSIDDVGRADCRDDPLRQPHHLFAVAGD